MSETVEATVEACTCWRCTLSPADAIVLKRGDDEKIAAVVAQAWKQEIENAPVVERRGAREFCFRQENATLGNLLEKALLRDPRVRIAAHRMDHPTSTEVKIMMDLKTLDWKHAPSVMSDVLRGEIESLQALDRFLHTLL